MGKTILRKVVVDVREFMSTLPAVLHQQGLDIIPTTLEVPVTFSLHPHAARWHENRAVLSER